MTDTHETPNATQRLARIAEAHHKHVDSHGGTWGSCNECELQWPCPTYVWAATDRDHLATWDPRDDADGPITVEGNRCQDWDATRPVAVKGKP